MIIEGKKNKYSVCIGLEVHCQLNTEHKLFSSSRNISQDALPNTNITHIDCAFPGMLPVLNTETLNKALLLGFELNAKIDQKVVFDRKNYFYPDLPQGYQISQFYHPIISDGEIEIEFPKDTKKSIKIERAHLEQDAGKLVHSPDYGVSQIDYNRVGAPLLEIVTAPVITSSDEAIEYLKTLRYILKHLNISDANMENGNFRCDANVSVAPINSKTLGTRCEIKNLNSFKFISDAITYEANLHVEKIENGEKIEQATKLYNPDKGKTFTMRSKEDALDYRYFRDPDIPAHFISDEELSRAKSEIKESFRNKLKRYTELGLQKNEIITLLENPEYCSVFDEISQKYNFKYAITWLLSEFISRCTPENKEKQSELLNNGYILDIIENIENGTVNAPSAKKLMDELFVNTFPVNDLIKKLNLGQISDTGAIEVICKKVVDSNPNQVEAYKSGKDKLFGFFVGQVMKETQGKANPEIINNILKGLLQK